MVELHNLELQLSLLLHVHLMKPQMVRENLSLALYEFIYLFLHEVVPIGDLHAVRLVLLQRYGFVQFLLSHLRCGDTFILEKDVLMQRVNK